MTVSVYKIILIEIQLEYYNL